MRKVVQAMCKLKIIITRCTTITHHIPYDCMNELTEIPNTNIWFCPNNAEAIGRANSTPITSTIDYLIFNTSFERNKQVEKINNKKNSKRIASQRTNGWLRE